MKRKQPFRLRLAVRSLLSFEEWIATLAILMLREFGPEPFPETME